MEKLCRIRSDMKTLEYHDKMIRDLGNRRFRAKSSAYIGFRHDIIPAEMLVETGKIMKSSSPYRHTYVISPSNGYVHYGAPASYYDKGGYEVTECMLAPEWQKIYERVALDIIRRL